jgi:hypothetical protein
VRLNLLLGAFLGTLLGISLAIGAEMRDRRVRGQEDVDQVFGLPLLVALPTGTQRRISLREGTAIGSRLRRLQFKRRADEVSSPAGAR